jgi:putative RecB family exonuclease
VTPPTPPRFVNFSYSAIETYLRCPHQYYLRHIRRMPESPEKVVRTLIGSSLQHAVESFYKNRWWTLSPGTLLQSMQDSLAAKGREIAERSGLAREPTLYRNLVDEGRALVPGVIDTIRRERLIGKQNLVEYELEVITSAESPKGPKNIKVHGRSDLFIEGFDDSITLVDGKAGRTVGRFASPNQLRFYALGWKQRFKSLPQKVAFWWYRHRLVKPVKLTDKSLDKLLTTIQTAGRGLLHEEYPAKVASHCRYCDHSEHCDAFQAAAAEARSKVETPEGINRGFISF